MKLNINFSALDAVIKNMKAPPTKWKAKKIFIDQHERCYKELNQGIEREGLNDIGSIGQKELLSYEGHQILLYIKSAGVNGAYIRDGKIEEEKKLHKFHILYCETLKKMKENRRSPRYVYTNRKDGQFLYDMRDFYTNKEETYKVELSVCKNCLKQLDDPSFETSDNFNIM